MSGPFIQLETARLYITSYQDQDFEHSLRLYSDEKILQYFDHGKSRSSWEVFAMIEGLKGKPFGLFSVFRKEDGEFLGHIDVAPTENDNEVEIGFIFASSAQGKGYCSEAMRAFFVQFVGSWQIQRVIATVHPENIASQKVLQKMGMQAHKQGMRFNQPRVWYALDVSPGIVQRQ